MKETFNVAFDENYSDKFMSSIAREGNNVVYVAPVGAPDEMWIMEAYYRGAEVIYSEDLDIPNFIEQKSLNMEWRRKH